MKKINRELIITSLICLLPIVAGLLLYDRLPERIATHFNMDGEADSWSGRGFAVFGLPLFMAATNLLVQFALRADPKKENMSKALRTISVWIIPLLSLLCSAFVLGRALGYDVRIEAFVPIFMGILFMLVGNYLPKTKQNYTMGIKLPWTLESEENWDRTHRVAGIIWMICGALCVILSLLGLWKLWLFIALILVMTLLPAAYSYSLYRKGI